MRACKLAKEGLLSFRSSSGEQRSCVAAVARVAVVEALSGRVVSDTNTGAYCRARSHIPESVPRRLALEMARDCEAPLPDEWRWKGRRVLLADGSTISLPDTPENLVNKAGLPASPFRTDNWRDAIPASPSWSCCVWAAF